MKKISILLPSRGRVAQTRKSLDSLLQNADDQGRFEICARIDHDDEASVELYKEYMSKHSNVRCLTGARLGYAQLNVLYDQAMSLSDLEADYVYVWGNDTIMETKGWDTKLAESTVKTPAVVWPYKKQGTLYYCFPVIHKTWFKLFGTFSEMFPVNPFIDTPFFFTMEHVVNNLPKTAVVQEYEAISGLSVNHLCMKDEVFNETDRRKTPRPEVNFLKAKCKQMANKLLAEWQGAKPK